MNIWRKATLALAAVWIVAGPGIWWLHATHKVNLLYADGHAEKTFTFMTKTQP